jgi:hypothetical protein
VELPGGWKNNGMGTTLARLTLDRAVEQTYYTGKTDGSRDGTVG